MGFPTELPRNAIAVLLKLFETDRPDAGHVALAAYDLVGYGLYQGFGDVKYMMGTMDFSKISKLIELLQSLDTSKLPHYAEIAAFVLELLTAKYSWPLIVLKVVLKFGPDVLPLLKQVYDVIKQLRG